MLLCSLLTFYSNLYIFIQIQILVSFLVTFYSNANTFSQIQKLCSLGKGNLSLCYSGPTDPNFQKIKIILI